jgi:hypothetical protein
MNKAKWIATSLGFSLITAACASALSEVRLEGLESLGGQLGEPAQSQPAGPLQELADVVEAEAPALDIVQIEIDAENNLIVFAILTLPESADQEMRFRQSLEALWGAAAERTPEVKNIGVGFMQIIPVNTLDRGVAPGGWMIGALTVPMDQATEYLSNPIDAAARDDFWISGVVISIPLNAGYTGTPNHSIRTLEA